MTGGRLRRPVFFFSNRFLKVFVLVFSRFSCLLFVSKGLFLALIVFIVFLVLASVLARLYRKALFVASCGVLRGCTAALHT